MEIIKELMLKRDLFSFLFGFVVGGLFACQYMLWVFKRYLKNKI